MIFRVNEIAFIPDRFKWSVYTKVKNIHNYAMYK